MDSKNRNSVSHVLSTPSTNKDVHATFGRISPDKDVKIPVGSLAKVNRDYTLKEQEKLQNQYGFLDDKGTKAYERLRKEVSSQALQEADPKYQNLQPSAVSTRKHQQYKTQEHHGNKKAEGLSTASNKSSTNHLGSIQRHKDKIRQSSEAYQQFGQAVVHGGKQPEAVTSLHQSKLHQSSLTNSKSRFSDNKKENHGKFPPLHGSIKKQKTKKQQQEQEVAFPDPSFSLKEIPFPNVERYRDLSDKYYDLLKDHVEHRDQDPHAKGPLNQKVVEYLNTGLYGSRAGTEHHTPLKSSLKQTTTPSKTVSIHDYEQKTFDPIKVLNKDVSAGLLPKYRAELEKQEEIHASIKKMLDPEKIMVFRHGPDKTKKEINEHYKAMHDEIEGMDLNLKKTVKKDKGKYMDEFEDYLRGLHNNYRQLEHTNRELSSYTKLKADIQVKLDERAKLNKECEEIDKIQRAKHEEMMKYKKDLSELNMELSFLEDQVNAAELNEFKLQMRYEELVEEINELKEEEKEENQKRSNASDQQESGRTSQPLGNQAYFQHVCADFEAYAMHIERKNARLREYNSRQPGGNKKQGLGEMIKESQDEIMELSAPFKKMFENAVEQTKGEIIQRNIKSRLHASKKNTENQLESKSLTQMNSQASLAASSEMSQTKRQDLANPVESNKILLSQFTESDKRNVVQKFLLSHEVLFLVYGLMFPSQTIAAANQALAGPFQQEMAQ